MVRKSRKSKKQRKYTIEDHKQTLIYLNNALRYIFENKHESDNMFINIVVDNAPFIGLQKTEDDVIAARSEYDEATDFFKDWVKICAEEIFLEKIHKTDYKYPSDLKCLLMAAILLSTKTIVGEDYNMSYFLTRTLVKHCGGDRAKMLRLERDLMITTNYDSCRKTMANMYPESYNIDGFQ